MAHIGRMNMLTIVKQVDFGFYLDGDDLGEILIPNRYVPRELSVDDDIEVFLYFDSEDRIIATTETPRVKLEECAHLPVVSTSDFGAFLDWGLPKELLVPFKEQRVPMREGKSYTVFVFLDATGRIAASSKLDKFLLEHNKECFRKEQRVSLHIASRSEMGYKAVINGSHLGLIHNSDTLGDITIGSNVTGYIKRIREDDRIDLMLTSTKRDAIDDLAEDIVIQLQSDGGQSTITDKSAPDEIYALYRTSKSNYKKALGKLYKEKRITLNNNTITLL